MSDKPVVLVTGATGKQGGAVVEHLLARSAPVQIHALTRNPASPAAQALEARGVKVVRGDLSNPSSLPAALTGVERAFLVTDFRKDGCEAETKQGTAFVDAAAAAGVSHICFTSVGNAEGPVPHFLSKEKVEQHLKATNGIPSWTILRPYAFMDNLNPKGGLLNSLVLGVFGAVLEGRGVQWISCDDIGWFGASSLIEPKKYAGRTIDLAGDVLDVEGVRTAYAKGWQGARPWKMWIPQNLISLMLPAEASAMFKYIRTEGYKKQIDIQALREEHPGMLTFDAWVKKYNVNK